MDSALLQQLSDLARRVENLIRPGTIDAADYDAARVRVRAGDLVTNWIPWLTTRAGGDREWWAPEEGEQVLLLSPSGDPAQAYALPAVYQTASPANGVRPTVHRASYQDGAVIEYDRAAHRLRAVLPSGATTVLVSPGGVSIVGDTTITGKLHTTDDITTEANITADHDITDHNATDPRTMAGMRDTYDRHTHTDSTGGTTSQPNQTMGGA